ALRWWIAFGEEVLHEGGPGRERAEATLDHRLSTAGTGIFLWEDAGEVVSLAGWGGRTPNGIRVGPVYTPPELRGRGYATALTAELSQQLLDGRLVEGGLAEGDLDRLEDLAVADPFVDRVRGRVREIGIEEAEAV